MGRGIQVYSVDTDRLSRALGSNDPALLAALAPRCDDATWKHVQSLVKSGEAGEGNAGDIIYAFEVLCVYFGDELNNSAVSPIDLATIEGVEDLFQAHPAGLSLHGLIYDNGFFEFDDLSDFPQFGYWSREEVKAAAPLFEEHPPEDDDPEFESILLAASDWLTIANAQERALFGFIY